MIKLINEDAERANNIKKQLPQSFQNMPLELLLELTDTDIYLLNKYEQALRNLGK
jgi:hypothetical protein